MIEVSTRRGSHLKWLVIVGAWAANALMMMYQTYFYFSSEGKALPMGRIVLPAVVYSSLWMLLTPLVLAMARRFPLDRSRWGRHLAIHLVTGFGLAFSQRFASESLVALLRSDSQWPFSFGAVMAVTVGYFDYGLLVYWIIVLISHGIQSYQRIQAEHLKASRLETKLAEARLHALKMQLHPHFLFNTLNSISALIHVDRDAADRMIARLGDFLRMTLENSGADKGPLRKELDAIRCYFDIEEVRFGDRVKLEMDIDPATLDASIPCFVWQPVLENALHHGFATSEGRGRILVRSRSQKGSLILQIQDNGIGLTKSEGQVPRVREGIGLASTRSILQQLYGLAYRFEVTDAPDGGVLATLEIPFARDQSVNTHSNGGRNDGAGTRSGNGRRRRGIGEEQNQHDAAR